MLNVITSALSITGFVFMMMLLIEYVNVLTSGVWQKRLARHRWSQYGIAALLGVTPGCLGAFTVVGLYSHRLVGVGAVVTAMIATSGDEAFVIFAIIPRQAAIRGVLVTVRVIFIFGIASGQVGPEEWNWLRVTILVLSVALLLIVGTVPEHFLEEHLWKHVVRQHLPQVFAWTLGTLLAMYVLTKYLNLEGIIRENLWVVLLIACLVGVIPESGPHLVFLTLFVAGTIPASILLASSIVQDGHGMLPMLAHSRKVFAQVKAINLAVGLATGAAGLILDI